MRLLKIAFVLALLAIFCVPVVQMESNLFPQPTLSGMQRSVIKPSLSVKGLFDSSFQTDFVSWFNQNYGMREFLIKVHNQICYSLLHEPGPTGESIVIGKTGQLYSKPYIESYLQIKDPIPIGQLENVVSNIALLQKLLTERGICFVVFLTPGKASIYPEYIPDSFHSHSRGLYDEDYHNFLSLLKSYGINHVDSTAILREYRQSSDTPLFPTAGMHWNEFGALLAVNSLLDRIGVLTSKDLGRIEIEKMQPAIATGSADSDLLDLLNIWFHPRYTSLKLELRLDSQSWKPSMVFEGGSFNYIPLGQISCVGLASSLQFINYYNYLISYPDPQLIHRQIDRLNWEGEIFTKDVIVLEVNEVYITGKFDQFASGFVRDAIIKLEGLDAPTKH